jgi:Fe-S oxidoreductase
MAEIPNKILVKADLVAELRAIVGSRYVLVEKEDVIVYEQDGSTFQSIPVRLLLPEAIREIDSLLPTIPEHFFAPAKKTLMAIGKHRATVALLNGCVMPLLFGEVNAATVRVLQRNGCNVVFPKGQTCCGALNIHNGETVAAKQMARRNRVWLRRDTLRSCLTWPGHSMAMPFFSPRQLNGNNRWTLGDCRRRHSPS